MMAFERIMAIETCREACRHNALRTAEEAADLQARTQAACKQLGIEYPEDAIS